MKKFVLMSFLSVFFLVACEYDAPLTPDHSIPIDLAVLGCWKIVPGENENDTTEIRIFPFSETEYSIHYSEDNDDLYFRAYAVNVGGIPAIQLEVIGTDEQATDPDDDDRYQVVAYKLVNGFLEIRTLNSDLVDAELPDSESLRAAFIEHKDNPELFNDPGKFRRIEY